MRRTKNSRFAMYVILSLLLVSALTIMSPRAYAAEASGSCGDGVSWSLDAGVLTISGSGEMTNYTEHALPPWNWYAKNIHSVVVENGVTTVGDFAFFQLKNMTAATIPNSVTNIGAYAFYECTALELLNMGDGVQVIQESAFERCAKLMSVRLPNGLRSLGNQAFYRCESLLSITVPASVTYMGREVFAYCSGMQSAVVQANIEKLPIWSFYGCYNLSDVTLGTSIHSVGASAFEHCDKLPESFDVADEPKNVNTYTSTTKEENGQNVTTHQQYTEKENSSVNVQVSQTQNNAGEAISAQITAVVDNRQSSWDYLFDQVNAACFISGEKTVEVNLHIQGDPVISGLNLARFSGLNVNIHILTQQGARWHIRGTDIPGEGLKDSYNLSFTLRTVEKPTDAQNEILEGHAGYSLVFASDINFKVEVELHLGTGLARDTAVFFSPEKDGFQRMQAVVIDGEGVAHFYLASVQAKTEYLIGINVPDRDSDSNISDAIIPTQMQNEYPAMEQIQPVEYVVTGAKSSWGMDIKQVTGILAVVMVGSFVIVGVVMGILFKRKLKQGYVPDMRYADEVPESERMGHREHKPRKRKK